MHLTVGRTTIPDPSDTQILAVLEDLSDPLAILGIDDQTFILAVRTVHGFVVQYREGSKESHRESTQTHDLETVKNLFLLYHKQDPRHKSLIEYKQWQPPSPSFSEVRIGDLTPWGWLVAILYLVAMLAAFVPVAYWMGDQLIPTIRGDEWLIVLLLVIPFFFMTRIIFSRAQALLKRFGISLFRKRNDHNSG